MRIFLFLILFLSFFARSSEAGETVDAWLDIASNPKTDIREREYAARQVIMLADSSASILIAAMRGEHSDSGLRRQVAAKILGEIGSPEFEAPLCEAAFGEDYFLAEAAKSALARVYSRLSDEELRVLLTIGIRDRHAIPGGVSSGEEDWLTLTMRHGQMQGRFKALVMAGLARKYAGSSVKLPHPLVVCVWDALRDNEPELRLQAVRVASCMADDETPEKLAAFLYLENEVKLLRSALRAMAAMRPPDYGEAVERHAAHVDPSVAIEALAALAAMGYPEALFPRSPGARAVVTFVNHPSTPVRRRTIEILSESKNPAALDFLEIALTDRVGANRAAAARALGELGFTAAVGALLPLRGDGRPEVRCEASIALARLGVVGVSAGVTDDLVSGSMPFRIAAASALGEIGDSRAIPALLRAAAEEDVPLACAAVESIGLLKDKTCGKELFILLQKTKNPVIAESMRRTLGELFLDEPGLTPEEWSSWAAKHGIQDDARTMGDGSR